MGLRKGVLLCTFLYMSSCILAVNRLGQLLISLRLQDSFRQFLKFGNSQFPIFSLVLCNILQCNSNPRIRKQIIFLFYFVTQYQSSRAFFQEFSFEQPSLLGAYFFLLMSFLFFFLLCSNLSTSKTTISNTPNTSEEVTSIEKIRDLQNIRASYRLNGKNYLKWSQFICTQLKGRGRLSHLLGTGPTKRDPTFEAWDKEDSMIMSWLWDFMDPMISDTYMFLATSKEIQDFIHSTYSKDHDAA